MDNDAIITLPFWESVLHLMIIYHIGWWMMIHSFRPWDAVSFCMKFLRSLKYCVKAVLFMGRTTCHFEMKPSCRGQIRYTSPSCTLERSISMLIKHTFESRLQGNQWCFSFYCYFWLHTVLFWHIWLFVSKYKGTLERNVASSKEIWYNIQTENSWKYDRETAWSLWIWDIQAQWACRHCSSFERG